MIISNHSGIFFSSWRPVVFRVNFTFCGRGKLLSGEPPSILLGPGSSSWQQQYHCGALWENKMAAPHCLMLFKRCDNRALLGLQQLLKDATYWLFYTQKEVSSQLLHSDNPPNHGKKDHEWARCLLLILSPPLLTHACLNSLHFVSTKPPFAVTCELANYDLSILPNQDCKLGSNQFNCASAGSSLGVPWQAITDQPQFSQYCSRSVITLTYHMSCSEERWDTTLELNAQKCYINTKYCNSNESLLFNSVCISKRYSGKIYYAVCVRTMRDQSQIQIEIVFIITAQWSPVW